ncbi:MAG: hypothetical protein GXO00_00885 [Candidatus Diapherotrites archaeon]|nr:hypothetical protein [Candidatus Diapherotrites archaeon]
MRGFIFSSIYFILFLLSVGIVTATAGSLKVIPSPSMDFWSLPTYSAQHLFGNPTPCYYDINTYDELNKLSLPEVKGC